MGCGGYTYIYIYICGGAFNRGKLGTPGVNMFLQFMKYISRYCVTIQLSGSLNVTFRSSLIV